MLLLFTLSIPRPVEAAGFFNLGAFWRRGTALCAAGSQTWSAPGTYTFTPTQSNCVYDITVVGAGGSGGANGGEGGQVAFWYTLPGSGDFRILVGQTGAGGFGARIGGGGSGGEGYGTGYVGGGASSVKFATTVLAVSGGGGGFASGEAGAWGGQGGGGTAAGQAGGLACGGGGGGGGTGGAPCAGGYAGGGGSGGAGGSAGSSSPGGAGYPEFLVSGGGGAFYGGGGGGGYGGGGGGGVNTAWGSGGGGGGYLDASAVTVTTAVPTNTGDGTVTIRWAGTAVQDHVPAMTSDTTPSGIVTYSSLYSALYAGWAAFNDNNPPSGSQATWHAATTGPGQWLAYEFPSPKVVNRWTVRTGTPGTHTIGLEAWDGAAWLRLDTRTFTDAGGFSSAPLNGPEFLFSNSTAYLKYRVYWDAVGGDNYARLYEVEFGQFGI